MMTKKNGPKSGTPLVKKMDGEGRRDKDKGWGMKLREQNESHAFVFWHVCVIWLTDIAYNDEK